MCIKKYDRIPESGIARIPMAIAYRSDRASVIKTICRGVVGRAKLLLYRTCPNDGDPFITRLVIARIFFSPSINIALTATKSCRRRPIRQHKRVTTTHRRSIIIFLVLLSSSYILRYDVVFIIIIIIIVRPTRYLFVFRHCI